MSKHKVNGFVTWEHADYMTEPEVSFRTYRPDPKCSGAVVVTELEIEVEVPDNFDPVPKQIEVLREKRNEVSREFTQALSMIDSQIGKLLAIEHSF